MSIVVRDVEINIFNLCVKKPFSISGVGADNKQKVLATITLSPAHEREGLPSLYFWQSQYQNTQYACTYNAEKKEFTMTPA